MGKTLEKLESPFMDEEISPASRQQLEFVPADDEKVEALDGEELEQRDGDESESTFDAEDADGQGESTWTDRDTEGAEWETALLEESGLNEETDQPEGTEPLFEGEEPALDPADTIDEAAAQCLFSQTVRDRLEPMLDVSRARAASAWNGARHPAKSGVSAATLLSRLERYVNRSAMRNDAALKGLAGDAAAVLAVVAHQFQQKIYVSSDYHDGKVGEGTLDALGFVRHRDDALNAVDRRNVSFHVKGRSKAFKRLQELYQTDRAAFQHRGTDVSPNTWYRLFVNVPFLGRPSFNGIHVELMRRLRQAEKWLLVHAPYRKMSPVEIGRAMNIDEDHHGGRMTNNNSMHTLGLAVDIRYLKNPWVTGQHGNDGKPNTNRNRGFQEVSRNISRLLHGTDEVWTPAWLHGLMSRVFYRDNSGTAACGKRFAAVAPKTSKRLQVMVVGEGHCAVPIKRLPKLLNPASVSPAPKTRKEIDEERFDEAFAWDENLGVNRQPEHGEADATDQEMEADEYEADEYENHAQERGEAEGEDLEVDQAAEEQGNAASDHEREDDDRP